MPWVALPAGRLPPTGNSDALLPQRPRNMSWAAHRSYHPVRVCDDRYQLSDRRLPDQIYGAREWAVLVALPADLDPLDIRPR